MRATIKSDCLNVVRSANAAGRTSLGPGRLYAGIALDKWTMAVKDKLIEEVSWVKAHRTKTGNEDEATALDIKGNAAADRLAAEAVSSHDQPSAEQKDRLLFYLTRAPLVAKAIGVALATFPAKEDRRLRRVPRPSSVEEAKHLNRHWWTFSEDSWRCALCGKWSNGDRLGPKLRAERCDGHMAEGRAGMWHSLGHRIRVAGGAYTFAYCAKCGAWGSRRSYKLQQRCAAPTAAGAAALKRIARGLHPWRKKLAGGGEAPRSAITVKAAYVPEANAWMGLDQAASGQPTNLSGHANPGSENHNAQWMESAAGTASTAAGGQCNFDVAPSVAVPLSAEGDEFAEDPFGHGGGLDDETCVPADVREGVMQVDQRCDGPGHETDIGTCIGAQFTVAQAISPQPERGDKRHEGSLGAAGPTDSDDGSSIRRDKRLKVGGDQTEEPEDPEEGGDLRARHHDQVAYCGDADREPMTLSAAAAAKEEIVRTNAGAARSTNNEDFGSYGNDREAQRGIKRAPSGGESRPASRGAKDRLDALRLRILGRSAKGNIVSELGSRNKTAGPPVLIGYATNSGTKEKEGSARSNDDVCTRDAGRRKDGTATVNLSPKEETLEESIAHDDGAGSSASKKIGRSVETSMGEGAKARDARVSVDIAREGPGPPPPPQTTLQAPQRHTTVST